MLERNDAGVHGWASLHLFVVYMAYSHYAPHYYHYHHHHYTLLHPFFFHPTFGEWRCVWGDEGWGRKAGSRASYICAGFMSSERDGNREKREESITNTYLKDNDTSSLKPHLFLSHMVSSLLFFFFCSYYSYYRPPITYVFSRGNQDTLSMPFVSFSLLLGISPWVMRFEWVQPGGGNEFGMGSLRFESNPSLAL